MSSEESYPALISLAVHELRTPANVVWGYLKMLKRDGQSTLGAHERHLVDEAEKSCARLAELMTELSDVGKLDAGQVPMARRQVDFFGLVGETAASLHEGEDRGVRIEVRGQSTGASVEGDPDRLRQALAAVIRSVLREQPGPCTIVADRQRTAVAGTNTAVVIVADEARVQAGDAGSAAFNDKRGGLGLALPIARRVIEAHGGQLRSRGDGAVTISVPLAT
jgi:hypothetical protein